LKTRLRSTEKPASRANVVAACAGLDFGDKMRAFGNGLDTPFAYETSWTSSKAPAIGSISCCCRGERAGDVAFVDRLLTQIESARGFAPGRIGIEAQIEARKDFSGHGRSRRPHRVWKRSCSGRAITQRRCRMPVANIGELG
jgi:citrate lyase subunit beta/citryl-CoA lyase